MRLASVFGVDGSVCGLVIGIEAVISQDVFHSFNESHYY